MPDAHSAPPGGVQWPPRERGHVLLTEEEEEWNEHDEKLANIPKAPRNKDICREEAQGRGPRSLDVSK